MISVQKYGGVSVATAERLQIVARHIANQALAGKQIVAVVSAMGDQTNELEQLARKVCGKKPPKEELDKLLATGEEQSAALLAMALKDEGLNALSLNCWQLGIEADNDGRIRRIRGAEKLSFLLSVGKIVVIAGFQGIIEETDEIVTLGKGGSDLTAIAIAAALKQNRCIIYTDVDGVYAIDPRIVPQAKKFDLISYWQMTQLALAGAAVLMARSMSLAQNLGVEIQVLLSPSLGESKGGSLVTTNSRLDEMESAANQAAIAVKKATQINIAGVPNIPGIARMIFGAINEAEINILDSAQTASPETAVISLLCQPEDAPCLISKLTSAKEKYQEKIGKAVISEPLDVALLTLVTSSMLEEPGYFNRVFKTLDEAGINIEMFSSSGPAISVAIKQENLSLAAQRLAATFNLSV